MKLSGSIRTPLLVATIVAVILWTEAWTWRHIRDVRDQADAVDSERFHHSAQLEARFRALHDAVVRYALDLPASVERGAVIQLRQDLTHAFSGMLGSAATRRENDTIQRARTQMAGYLAAIDSILEGSRAPNEVVSWREREGKVSEEVISTFQELADAERMALAAHLAVAQASARALHRQFVLSSIALLAMGGALAVIVYQGVVAPLQERLRHSQSAIERQEKLSSLGVLAAGVAHEIRNPLTSIKVRLFTQQQLLKNGTEEFEDNLFLTDEISRLEKIVKDFLEFARPSDPEFAVVPASQPMRELIPLLLPSLRKSNVRMVEEYIDDPPILADSAQIKQTLINLIKNAAEAMPDGGVVTLRTCLGRSGRATRGDSMGFLEVSDTGPGIPLEVQKRLFDPFFTTKPSGTGLGLSIAARIIEKHDGLLEFTTEPGRGTTFRIVLPLATT